MPAVLRRSPSRGVEWEFDRAHDRARLLAQRGHQDARRSRRARRVGARSDPCRSRRHPSRGPTPQDHPDATHADLSADLRGSDLFEQAVEDPRSELQRLHRHSFVDAVEEGGEVEVVRQSNRGEAIAAQPQPSEMLGVGAARSSGTARLARPGPRPGGSGSSRRRGPRRTASPTAAGARRSSVRSPRHTARRSCRRTRPRYPGRKRPSTCAVASVGTTFTL